MKVASSIVSVLFLGLFSTSVAADSGEDCLDVWHEALIATAPDQWVEYVQDECFAYSDFFTFALSGFCADGHFAYISVGVSNQKVDEYALQCSVSWMGCNQVFDSEHFDLDGPQDYGKVRGEWSKFCNKNIRSGERNYKY